MRIGKPAQSSQPQPSKGTLEGIEGLDMTINPRGSVKEIITNQNQLQAEAKAEEDKAKKKKKVVIGMAIGVGVISIIALIYLLRKK
jgi:hypothetical protein